MGRFNTIITKKDGTRVKGYIENGKSYYSNGSRISAGDSVRDSKGRTWTMKGNTGTQNRTSGTSSVPTNTSVVKRNQGGSQRRHNTYITRADGTQSKGYISGGKSYYEDGRRLGTGDSVFDNQGRRWTMGADGKGYLNGYAEGARPVDERKPGSGTYNPDYNPSASPASEHRRSDEYITAPEDNTISLQEAYEKRQRALREKINQNVSEFEGQKGRLGAGYDDAARQAYITKMQSQRALEEQLAARGQNGGATETANLGIDIAYQNNLANINRAKVDAINNIDTEINRVKSAGSIQEAQMIADGVQRAYEAQARAIEEMSERKEKALADAKKTFTETAGAYARDYQAQINKIDAMIRAGIVYDSDGISLEYKRNYLNSLRNEKILRLEKEERETQKRDFEERMKLQNLDINQERLRLQQAAHALKANKGRKVKELSISDIEKLFRSGAITSEQYLDALEKKARWL